MSEYIERYWRDAKPEDAIKEPPMACRMRFDESGDWYDAGHLMGCDRSSDKKWITNEWQDRQCQVYDAPDPGEGWRLIDVPEVGDEWMLLFKPEIGWKKIETEWSVWSKDHAFRRRITPTVTYVPFTWDDREQLRGRWITRDNQELQLVNLDNSDGFFANGVHVVNLCLYWKFIDTGKPVGKEVVQ